MDLQFNWVKDLPEWGTFVGTFMVSFLAMFSNRLKNWFCRPRLEMQIKGTKAHCELIEDEVDDRSDSGCREKEYRWCLRVRNRGKTPAVNCRVQCAQIYQEQDSGGNFILKREFISQPFYWQSGVVEENVVPGRDSWCRIFILSSVEVQHKNVEGKSCVDESASSARLHLRLGVESGQKGRYISLRNKGKNTFLLPLMVSYDNAKSANVVWLYVHWTDGDSKPTADNLTIEIYDEVKARGLIKESI